MLLQSEGVTLGRVLRMYDPNLGDGSSMGSLTYWIVNSCSLAVEGAVRVVSLASWPLP